MLRKSIKSLRDFITHWIVEGEILDPYNEFFIQINSQCNKVSEYWIHGFNYKRSRVPLLLSEELSLKILELGKVVRLLKKANQSSIIEYLRNPKFVLSNDHLLITEIQLEFSNWLSVHIKEKMNILHEYIFKEKKLKQIMTILHGVYFTQRGEFA